MTDTIRDADKFLMVDSPQQRTPTWAQIKEQLAGDGYMVEGDNNLGSVGLLTEVVTATLFEAQSATEATFTMAESLVPAGARIIGTFVKVTAGFAGDVSCVLTIGDGSDVDRYNTGTIDIFTTAATGVQTGVPSGALNVLTDHNPVLTITSAAVVDNVIAGAGSITVTIIFARTV